MNRDDHRNLFSRSALVLFFAATLLLCWLTYSLSNIRKRLWDIGYRVERFCLERIGNDVELEVEICETASSRLSAVHDSLLSNLMLGIVALLIYLGFFVLSPSTKICSLRVRLLFAFVFVAGFLFFSTTSNLL